MIERFIFFLILMGAAHVLCDLPLQPGALSVAKRPGGDADLPWPMALGGHALIHGGAVAWITGSAWLGLAEIAAHGAIDFGKVRGLYAMKADQALHLACKFAWALLAVRAVHG